MNKIITVKNYNDVNNISNIIRIDLNEIENIQDFIKKIYSGLGCPKNFGLNLNAFFDTISDIDFWVKAPLNLVIINFDLLYSKNINLRMLISDILIDIISINNNQNYNIYILQS